MALLRMAIVVSALLAGAAASEGGAAAPTNLGVNGLTESTGLDSASFPVNEGIVLTWEAPAGLLTGQRSDSSFVVDLTGTLAGGTPLTWSSGTTKSSDTMLPLPSTLTSRFAPGATFAWKVRISTDGGAWSPWGSSSFDTSPAAAAWEKAAWIGGGSELRSDFALPEGKTIARARAYATGVGAFELHVNGAKVGDHVLDPGEAVYDQKVLFLSFNLTSLLRAGHNAVGARLGNSKFGYLDIYTNRTALGDQSGDASRAFRLVLVATLSDGSEHSLVSSADGWHSRHGPIVYDHLWHGEIYDARQELDGWSAKPIASFPSGSWSAARLMQPKAGRLYPQLMPPIRKVTTYPAVSQKKLGDGSVIFDFGHNMAGLSTLRFDPARVAAAHDAEAPVTVMLRLKHTELVSRNGSSFNNYYPGMENFNGVHSATCSMEDWYEHKWYECANQTDGYVFTVPSRGDTQTAAEPVEYTQSFTYHGFRHVELVATEVLADGSEGPLPASLASAFPWGASVTAHRSHTDMAPLTRSESSD